MGIEDLPVHRREALLWRYALDLDYDGVDDLVREAADIPCRWDWGPDAIAEECVAVVGDDGRYHLVVNGEPQCAVERERGDPAGAVRHGQWCYWWTDGARYRVQAPPGSWGPDGLICGEQGHLDVSWLVTLTDAVADPALVPVRRRCVDTTARGHWPGYQGSDTPLGRQRAQLAAALGPRCHACRLRPGTDVDHDHFTGLVRGLLCEHCNSHVDKCVHVSGCPWADYLNDPPAAYLRLRYAKPERVGRDMQTAARIEYLGFDPLYRGVASRRPRFPVRQLPPPARADGIDMSTVEEAPLF
ncbi:endonuclease domain-containing protein [Planosporangium mesophilum]|uniref:endonuclease domain-containing protein n=1 Tax=Planosporangium mesophilum TaxID=689768 RepID=UPI00194F24EF|nr:endonuclease domain-containing protein [Planosporangium mesophilum]